MLSKRRDGAASSSGLRQVLNLDGGSSAQLFARGATADGTDLSLPGLVLVPNALVVVAK